ncbi:conserved hypothetical protein [Neospora caninum Liverpool]|uniref:Transmembrane protein n=1 Tax=Neospora caninum (strain Liverpool) TaxID=572307 RepID=F0VI52_NEOCL|nr:conserved hypothetical protein [Neospora caninum Liverpool]CBZ53413.1 conserved hypothetical protein [Neospora caninum Liverpool]CEL67400.1 TPA: hypothetical protein BN1204_032000 [Neospora caninum Liverpool]|eukprot:XP_003883445.1 conserved hypothetical protein [Neospora caninum Liverpool]
MRTLLWGLAAGVPWFFIAGVVGESRGGRATDGNGEGSPSVGLNHTRSEAEVQSAVVSLDAHESQSAEVDEDEGPYSVAQRFRLMVVADHLKDGIACEKEVVLQAADISGLRIGGPRPSFNGGLLPLVGLPFLAAAGLKNHILGVKGAEHDMQLPGESTLTPYDIVDGAVDTRSQLVDPDELAEVPTWKSKAFIGSAVALASAIIAGFASSWWAAKRERSRRGLLGSGRTVVWDVSDCILLVDVGQAQAQKAIFGTFVRGSARLVVDHRRQRGRLLYEERPPLVGHLVSRLRGKNLARFEDFQLSTPDCYFRPDFDPHTPAKPIEVRDKRRGGVMSLPQTAGDLFFRELLDSKGKRTEGLALHFVRNPGWVSSTETASLTAASRAIATDLDFTLLMRQAASESVECLGSEETGSGGRPVCWRPLPEAGSLFLWQEEVTGEKCTVVAAFRGSVSYSVRANFATQELSIGSDASVYGSMVTVRRVLSKCLLLERNPPHHGVAVQKASIPCHDTSAAPCGSILVGQETEEEGDDGYNLEASLKKAVEVAYVASPGEEELDLVGASAARQRDYRVRTEASKASNSVLEFFTVFTVHFQRKPADWPVLFEMRKKGAARTRV